MFVLSMTLSIYANSQDMDNVLFRSQEFSQHVEALIDSAKVEVMNLNNNKRYVDVYHIDTALFYYLPVLNATLSMTAYCLTDIPTLSEVLLIDKRSGRIVGAVHFSLIGPFTTFVNDKYFRSHILPWDEKRLHYIPQNCYKSLSKKLKNESQKFYLISVLETRSAYILREQQLPLIENRKEYPEPICQ